MQHTEQSLQPFNIIYHNDDFVVVNKPANINFHDEDNPGKGLFNQVKNQFSELYPVHRLDKMTSGLILFAKNKETAAKFGQMFEQHEIQKYYIAISRFKPKKKQGWIKGDMEKSRRSSFKLLRTMNNPAVTQFFSYSIETGLRLFLLRPLTGKTHQLRVALNSIGSAIAGDDIYNTAQQKLDDRGYLHAYALYFNLNNQAFEFIQTPDSGELFLQENCQNIIATIKKPGTLPWPKV